jgi:Inner membrane protein YgaP-like, transmembrane domain
MSGNGGMNSGQRPRLEIGVCSPHFQFIEIQEIVMTSERIVRIVAGFFIMLSLALAHFTGQANLGEVSWLWFTAFVGINLFQSGFTRICPLDMMLRKAGVKEGGLG